MIRAEKVYKEILEMPIDERVKLFSVMARRGFEKDFYSHAEVFGDIGRTPFTIKEAAEYLEVAVITVRRWVKEGKLKTKKVGRSLVFDVESLKKFRKIVTVHRGKYLIAE